MTQDSGLQKPLALIVDDEDPIRKNLEILLTRQNWRVVAVKSGEEALPAALQERPDIVLLDIMMGGMDGYETCRRLKQEASLKHVPVLLLTALNDVFSKVKGLDAGADDFITKPFNDTELRARVAAFLRTKRLHDELEKSYQRLKELEELKESLTYMIVHDLMAPLTAIQIGVESVLDFFESKDDKGGGHGRILGNAHEGCRRLMDLLRDVLQVARLEENKLPLDRKPADFSKIVSITLATLEAARKISGVTFESAVDPKLPPVPCDEGLVTRVLTNLVSNSIKFSEEGGLVRVVVKDVPEEGALRCTVEDQGMGIPARDLDRIFDKFFQGKGEQMSRKGQGLGLAFCRLAVEAHDGKIWVESEEGKGSRFVFQLPLKIKPTA